MNWWDYLFTFISFCCTIFSICSAWKSKNYYHLNKKLIRHTNINLAYLTSQEILKTFTALLNISRLMNSLHEDTRGKNLVKDVSKYGEDIKTALAKIRNNLSYQDCIEIDNSLINSYSNIHSYIDSFITGSVLINNKLVIDGDFSKCQEAFSKIQLMLKKKIETIDIT